MGELRGGGETIKGDEEALNDDGKAWMVTTGNH